MVKTKQLVIVVHLCSFLVVLYSLSMIPPLLMALLYKEKSIFSFFYTLVIAASVGGLGWFSSRQSKVQLRTQDGFLIIVLFWLLFSIISALPLWLDDTLNISLVDAMFEGVSGITTTGASVLNDVSSVPKSFLYYRAQLNFVGGLGVIVLAVAVLPLLGIGGAKLYQSEMPGPFKEERLTPRLADTAKNLWLIYLGLGLLCTLAFRLAGMPWFDALCHALSTVSLGGFSTRNESLGYFDSAPIELVGGVFSVLAAINFTLFFVAVSRRSLKPLLRNPELRFFLLILSIIVTIVVIELYRSGMYGLKDALVHGFFLTSSMMTDNGLATADYAKTPTNAILLLLGASFFGGCVGSTCGGIKALRFLIMYKVSRHEVNQLVHPNAIFTIKVGDASVHDRVLRSVWSFFFLYVLFSCLFVWALNLMGYDMMTAFATVAACINNMGLGFGETAAGFGTLSDPAKWLMCAAMLLGRLEIYPILILCSRTFWRF
ncbi:TPA: potassium transporter TrkG [Serratia rubidaea]|uniref:TrkH family potassium uptake protein n=1 Tax=Serratia rubidaea TaxID=61652 RepID=UPI0023AF046B|nr:TrkH family potassium uptake protein [Serratia rubidaea]MDK1703666.1 TrkH family potassium uptake protein [Serratia rubidaea]HDJ1438766.1 potassium transporter TrkG [Serratia rubidaea]HDJ1449323.1 potassium transporter TrkG [Serratia rubidaea]HDJ1461275.1 potassium transporter TrkG [Serratia rubidaea]HDJ2772314.1 potassium transporter TrkG [Serratia rubidaea]